MIEEKLLKKFKSEQNISINECFCFMQKMGAVGRVLSRENTLT